MISNISKSAECIYLSFAVVSISMRKKWYIDIYRHSGHLYGAGVAFGFYVISEKHSARRTEIMKQ